MMNSLNKNLIILITIIAMSFAAWYFSQVVIYIVIAAILALIGQPIDKFFSKIKIGKFKLPDTISTAFAFLTLLLAFISLLIFFTPLVMEEASILSSLDRSTLIGFIQTPMQNLEHILKDFNVDLKTDTLQSYMQDKLVSILTVTNLSLFFNQIISSLGNFFVAFFAISFLTFFFLRDEKKIVNIVVSAMPAKYSEKIKNVWYDSQHMLKRYFIGILIEVLLVIFFLSIGLWIAGIKHALLIALFAGLVNVIPYVGPLIGTAFALFIGVTANIEASMIAVMIKILSVFLGVQIADAFLLQPFIYSSSVKAHPLEIFLVILIGATIGGIGGMILAVPSYTVLRVIAKEFFTKFRIVQQLTKKLGD